MNEQLWNESVDTVKGRQEHMKVHDRRIERRGNEIKLYEYEVISHDLMIRGKCDCIEAVRDDCGCRVPFSNYPVLLKPVEFKHGRVREEEEYDMQLCAQAMCLEEMYKTNIEDGDIFYNLPIDYTCIKTGEPLLTPAQEAKLEKYNKSLLIRELKSNYYNAAPYLKQLPYHFNYGYAITCWKSQGSEYANVLGYDAPWVRKKMPEQYSKYLYTMITRASERLILVGE